MPRPLTTWYWNIQNWFELIWTDFPLISTSPNSWGVFIQVSHRNYNNNQPWGCCSCIGKYAVVVANHGLVSLLPPQRSLQYFNTISVKGSILKQFTDVLIDLISNHHNVNIFFSNPRPSNQIGHHFPIKIGWMTKFFIYIQSVPKSLHNQQFWLLCLDGARIMGHPVFIASDMPEANYLVPFVPCFDSDKPMISL